MLISQHKILNKDKLFLKLKKIGVRQESVLSADLSSL